MGWLAGWLGVGFGGEGTLDVGCWMVYLYCHSKWVSGGVQWSGVDRLECSGREKDERRTRNETFSSAGLPSDVTCPSFVQLLIGTSNRDMRATIR